MTNEGKVKRIYPTAYLFKYGPNLWIIYHKISNRFGSMDSILGVSAKSPREAWYRAWEQCQKYMLKKLES